MPPAPVPGPELPQPSPAIGWLDAELPNLLAAARYAFDNADKDDIEVVDLLAGSVPPESWARPGFHDSVAYRLSMMANQAELARNRATTRGDGPTATREQRRLTILTDLAHRLTEHAQ